MHYGLHSASLAKTRLVLARERITLGTVTSPPIAAAEVFVDWRDLLFHLSGIDMRRCPACHQLALVRKPLLTARCRAPPEAA
jgi:hypothetical protein